MPLRSHVFVSDFDVDDFLAGLDRLGKVRPDALAYQYQLHQYDMSQVSPAYALQRIEVFPVVIGDVVEGQNIVLSLLSHFFFQGNRLLWMVTCMSELHIAVQDQQSSIDSEQQEHQEEVLDQSLNELT